jgi:hypothetical protein
MGTIAIEQKREPKFISNGNSYIVTKQYVDLEEFLKGTVSGEKLVKYVCNRLDEKYGENKSSSFQ